MKDFTYNLGGFLHLLTFKDYLIMLLIFVIMVLLLIIYYILKVKEIDKEEKEIIKNDSDQELDLKAIKEKIEQEEPKAVTLTEYEEEQEGKAIISYQELVEKNKSFSFSDFPDDEYQNFEIKVKKINLNDPVKKPIPKDEGVKIPMMNFESESEFLDALKKLQSKLVK